MTPRRILITGASGSIGHYVTEALIQETDLELYLLVRNPSKLRLNTQSRPGITVLPGDMRDITQFADLLKTIDVAVLAASEWGGPGAFDINVTKPLELLSLLDPATCQQVIYFSTASILDRHHQPLKEAGELGTYYIRSKYDCLQRLPGLAIAPRITILFPTLVVGGDAEKPYSYFSDALPKVAKWMNLIRFLSLDGSFHFIHGRDIAQVVRYLIDHPATGREPRSFVLGQEPLTVDQAVEEICAYLDKKIYFRIPVPLLLAKLVLILSQSRITASDRAWDRFCLSYRQCGYAHPTNPASFGLPNYCATLTDVLQLSGIARRGTASRPVDVSAEQ